MIVCEKCGAELGAVEPGVATKCTYCGTVRAATPVRIAPAIKAYQANGGSVVGCVALAAALFVALPIGLAVLLPDCESGETMVGGLVGAVAPSYTRMQDVRSEGGWQTIDPAGVPLPFTDLEPVALYPWALARAQQWAPDATLDNLSLRTATMDGHVDAHDTSDDNGSNAGIDFSFTSPARMQAAIAMRQVSTQKTMTSIDIQFSHGVVKVLGDDDVDDDPIPSAFPQPACSLGQVIATMRAHELDMRPAYDLMTTNNSGRWEWWINMTDVSHTPRVYADDCTPTR